MITVLTIYDIYYHGDVSTTDEVPSTASLVEASCLRVPETMLMPPVMNGLFWQ